jgi:hypothetical protein
LILYAISSGNYDFDLDLDLAFFFWMLAFSGVLSDPDPELIF